MGLSQFLVLVLDQRITVHTISEMMVLLWINGQDIDGERFVISLITGIHATNGIYSIDGKNYLFEKGN